MTGHTTMARITCGMEWWRGGTGPLMRNLFQFHAITDDLILHQTSNKCMARNMRSNTGSNHQPLLSNCHLPKVRPQSFFLGSAIHNGIQLGVKTTETRLITQSSQFYSLIHLPHHPITPSSLSHWCSTPINSTIKDHNPSYTYQQISHQHLQNLTSK